jgi:hypothetical protein
MSTSHTSPVKKYTPLAHLVPGVVLARAEGKTMQEIADSLSLSRQRIHQVIKAAQKMEETSLKWGFPFSVRTARVLDALAVDTKEQAMELYESGHLFPGSVWSFGQKSYREICEWLEVPPLSKNPRKKTRCPHCQRPL